MRTNIRQRGMKKLFVAIILVLLSGCKEAADQPLISGACSDIPYLGIWDQIGGSDVLTIKSDCTATTLLCQTNFTYSYPDPEQIYIIDIEVVSSIGGDSCYDVGETYRCTTGHNAETKYFQIDCTGLVDYWGR